MNSGAECVENVLKASTQVELSIQLCAQILKLGKIGEESNYPHTGCAQCRHIAILSPIKNIYRDKKYFQQTGLDNWLYRNLDAFHAKD